MIKFSIIVPVYNKEEYIKATLDSIVENHEINDLEFECICVNESSTDNSLSICEEYSKKYSYIKCYSILNDGVNRPSNARNFGKRVASGQYIMFLDADDILCSGFANTAISFLDNNTNYDLYLCNRYIDNIFYIHYTQEFSIYGPVLSCCIFRSSLIKNIDFKNAIVEDVLFTEEVLLSGASYYYDESNPASYNYNVLSFNVSEKDKYFNKQYKHWYASIVKELQYSYKYQWCLNDENLVIGKDTKKIHGVEIYLVDYCDLNCAYCANFSTLYNKSKTPRSVEHIINELSNLTKYRDDIQLIKLLGGEPLLHPKLGAILSIVRKMFPNNEIQIITNGTLYKRLPELQKDIINNNIMITLSLYPVENSNEIVSSFKQFIPSNLLYINSFPTDIGFQYKHLMKETHDEYDKIYHCIYRNSCTRLDGNKLYLCEYAANLNNLKDFYKDRSINLTNDDAFIELTDDVSADDIAYFCYNAVPDLCHHCANVLQENPEINYKAWDPVPWKTTKRELSEFYSE